MKGTKTKNALLFGTLVILVALLTVLVTLRRSPSDGGVAVGSVAKQATRVTNESTEEIRRDDPSSIQESIQLTPSEDRGGTNMARVTPDQTDQADALIGRDGEFVHLAHTNNPLATPLELVWIPPGTFVMGSPDGETGRRSNEGPQTQVTISRGFWMGKYEVTVAQCRAIHAHVPGEVVPMATEDDLNRPVTRISWQRATNFCFRLSQQEREAGGLPEGYIYRLPTEAEWEYACRAGTTTRFSFGDDPYYVLLEAYAWYGLGIGATLHPVGKKQPNPWGLYDMPGNASEWCLDDLGRYSGGTVIDPVGMSGKHVVIKDGAWKSDGASFRSAFRHSIVQRDAGSLNVGFRIVLGPILQ